LAESNLPGKKKSSADDPFANRPPITPASQLQVVLGGAAATQTFHLPVEAYTGVVMDSRPTLRKRTAGILNSRLPDLHLGDLADSRDKKGRVWTQPQLATATVTALMAGCKGMAESEALTDEMSPSMRKLVGVPRRLPDTTQRDWLCQDEPERFRTLIHNSIRAAADREALRNIGLPLNIASMDGKTQVLPCWDPKYAQHHSHKNEVAEHGELRTVTSCLITAPGRPCLDAFPIPADTNEMGIFPTAFTELMKLYRRQLDGVFYDAGAGSEHNAAVVVAAEKYYVFHLKDENRLMFQWAQQSLGELEEPAAQTVDWLSKGEPDVGDDSGMKRKRQKRPKRERQKKQRKIESKRKRRAGISQKVVRKLFICENNGTPKDLLVWSHTKTLIRVRSETYENELLVASEDRYFNTNIPRGMLTDDQWLLLIRLHWSVENNCHHTYDKAFEEDDRPWITDDSYGVLAVTLLRRVAYNLWTLFRSVTQRSDTQRSVAWKTLMRRMYNASLTLTQDELSKLRQRKAPVASI